MNERIKILVIDDHPVVRHGVVGMIREYGDKFHIVGEAVNFEDGMAKIQVLLPDVVVTDLTFEGDVHSGIDVVTEVARQHPKIRCVLITANRHGYCMVDAFKAGAAAFLYKDSDGREYVKAIEAAYEGMTYFPPQFAGELHKWDRLPKLTPAEVRVMPYVANGFTSKVIAREYNHLDQPKVVDSRTIDQHKHNIKQKFEIDSSGALVAFAIKYCDDNRLDYKNIKIHTKRRLLDF
jgi:DNA-binding NarL/FixJ family response regulator